MELLGYNNILLCSSLFFISMSTSLLVLLPVMYFMKPAPQTNQDTNIETQSANESEGSEQLSQGSDEQSQGSEQQSQGSDEQSEGFEQQSQGSEQQSQGSDSEGSDSEGSECDGSDILFLISEEFNKIGGLKLYVSIEDAPNDKWIRIVDKHSGDNIIKLVLEKLKSE